MADHLPEPVEAAAPGREDILEPGERILLQGRPDAVIEWGRAVSVQGIFGFFFAAFAVLWIMTAGWMTSAGGAGPIEDGSPGTVWFSRKVHHDPGGYTGPVGDRRCRQPKTTFIPVGFRRIAEPRMVYRLLADRVAALRKADGDSPLA